MLKSLRIQNLILIESAEIPFESGLNVLSGETGSGKSAILNALSLIKGDRADSSMIRHGQDKGSVEAALDISPIHNLSKLLEEGGISHELGEELIVRREISAAGKSRVFINNQMVQLSFLKQVGHFLFEMVGQHANQKLLNLEQHREILDLFGNLQEDVAAFSASWTKENQLRQQLETLVQSEAQRLRELETLQREVEEITSAKLKEEEEQELFSEYTLLNHSESLLNKSEEIHRTLSGDKLSVLPLLSRHQHTFEELMRVDPSLKETAEIYNSVCIELQEVAYTLRNYSSRIEHNPARSEEISERLQEIDRLKRRYGSSISDIQAYKSQIEKRLKELHGADEQIETLKQQLEKIERESHALANGLSQKRKQAAIALEKAIVTELRSLNMPKVEFACAITPQKRSHSGDDLIEFFLAPNVGEKQVSVRECASGGELSRVMLALQTLLAGKAAIPLLIFDEIDANIGGETACVIGEKLKKIGAKHQVLCITHFPQVAKHAQHHLQISKQEQHGRTFTTVRVLNQTARQEELSRMEGKKN